MDINLPGMSGFEAVQRLRELARDPGHPGHRAVGGGAPADTARAKEIGFYRYLTKPVKVDELTATLEELLDRPGQGSG